MIRFANHSLLTGAWFAAATSLALGNIDIDQAVVSAIAAIIAAAKVRTGDSMTPTSEVDQPRRIHLSLRVWGKCELLHTDRRLFA